jgi:PEGA domain-containing protein
MSDATMRADHEARSSRRDDDSTPRTFLPPTLDGLGEFPPELASAAALVAADQSALLTVDSVADANEFLSELTTAFAFETLWPIVPPALPGQREFVERLWSFSHPGEAWNVRALARRTRQWFSLISSPWIRPFTWGAAVGATTVFLLAEAPRLMRPANAPLSSASRPIAFTTPPPVPREDRIVVTTPPIPRARLDAQREVRQQRPARATDAAPAVRTVPPFIGGMEITSAPEGARVFVDGPLAGVTPLVIDSLRIGSHAVRVEAQDHIVWSSSVRVVANERTRVRITLTPR